MGKIGLPHHHVGRLAGGARQGVPNQHTVVIGVRNRQNRAVRGNAIGVAQAGGAEVEVGGDEVRLTQHQAGIATAHATRATNDLRVVVGSRVGINVCKAQNTVIVRG